MQPNTAREGELEVLVLEVGRLNLLDDTTDVVLGVARLQQSETDATFAVQWWYTVALRELDFVHAIMR